MTCGEAMKKLTNKKGWLLLAAILLCVGFLLALSACTDDKVQEQESGSEARSDSETEAVIDTEGKLVLALNGECKVTVVTAAYCTGSESNAATRVFNKLKNSIGSAPEVRDDFLSAGQSYDSEALEILVGETKYSETAEVLATLSYGDFAVRAVGNKIVICGSSPEGTVQACAEFVTLIQRNTQKKTLLLDKDLNVVGEALPIANDIPLYEGGNGERHRVNDTGDSCMAITVNGTSLAEVAAYQQKLTAAGYSIYDTRAIGKDGASLYAQYTNDTYSATVIYTAYESKARVFLEPLTATGLPPKAAEAYTATGDEPLLLQVGITYTGDTVQNGACYMVRLADGSFIVYDGGQDDTLAASKQYNRQNARRIYELLAEYGEKNDDGKYMIAAWVITHGHIDHIGAFEAFVEANYEETVAIERVICNLPSDEQIAADPDDSDMGGKMSAYRSVLNKAKTEGAVIHKAHPGQVFALRDGTLEVLYTYDLYCDTEIALFNNTSVVTRLNVGGQSVMITGDMQGDAAKAMIGLYGNTMKADFMSVPHHGWFYGGTQEFYACVAPKYVLWPIGNDRRDEVINANKWPVNQYFFDNDLKIFYALDKTSVIPLPYNGSDDVTFDNTVYS